MPVSSATGRSGGLQGRGGLQGSVGEVDEVERGPEDVKGEVDDMPMVREEENLGFARETGEDLEPGGCAFVVKMDAQIVGDERERARPPRCTPPQRRSEGRERAGPRYRS